MTSYYQFLRQGVTNKEEIMERIHNPIAFLWLVGHKVPNRQRLLYLQHLGSEINQEEKKDGFYTVK